MSLMDRMRASRGKTADAIKAATTHTGGFQKDERVWKYGYTKHPSKKDKSGQPLAISDSLIRFLPISFVDLRRSDAGELAPEAVLSPVIHVMRHDFKVGDKRYQELSRKTIGQECPVSDHDRPFWEQWKESGKPDNDLKKTLVKRLSKDEYYANILVIDDKAKPENNGKAFLFKFSNAIKKMIDEAFDPSIPTRASFDPFDAWEGKNLHLVFLGEERAIGSWKGLVPVEMGKESVWEDGQLCNGVEADMEAIMEQAYSLQDFVKPELFKSYEDLKARLMDVMGLEAGEPVQPETTTRQVSTGNAPDQSVQAQTGTLTTEKAVSTVSSVGGAPSQTETVGELDGDDIDEFTRLLQESNV